MTNPKLPEYLMYRKIIRLLLLMLGLWPIEKSSVFYTILPYIQLILNVITALAMLGFVRVHITNIALVTKCASIMVSYFTGTLKMVCMIIYREDTRTLHKNLDPHFSELLNKAELKNSILQGVTAFRRLSWAVSLLVLLSGTVYIVAPIIFIVYQRTHQVANIKYLLPYAAKYPWAIAPNGLLYKLHYVFESCATVSLIAITSSVDPLYTLYVFQMIGQLRELTHEMSQLSEKVNSQIVIRKCVNQYAVLMKCRDILQRIYGPLILWMILSNAMILCAGLFQLSQLKRISIGQIILFSAYVSTKMTQTFLCGWAGTRLTTESENYTRAVYAADWVGKKELMSSILIMLTQKPLVLTAYGFSVISVQIFSTVLNTTVSYYFLLQTLQA
uniref:Odorant receptor n=1 Tax=Aulacocentrum confusum TaxID=2767324 RepID=A0A7G8Z963_9HYME|nr:olfactory receptor 44 [Aulacocentrum confusum]